MGKAIFIPDVDFSGANLGKVTISSVIPIEGLRIQARESYVGTSANLSVSYSPITTTQKSVIWSIVDGAEYANISNGILTIKNGANNSPVKVKVMSADNNNIYDTKTINVTYSGSGGLSFNLSRTELVANSNWTDFDPWAYQHWNMRITYDSVVDNNNDANMLLALSFRGGTGTDHRSIDLVQIKDWDGTTLCKNMTVLSAEGTVSTLIEGLATQKPNGTVIIKRDGVNFSASTDDVNWVNFTIGELTGEPENRGVHYGGWGENTKPNGYISIEVTDAVVN